MPRLDAQAHALTARFSTESTTVDRDVRRIRLPGSMMQFAIVGIAVAGIVCGGVGWAIDNQVTQILFQQVAARATDHVATIILTNVTEKDFTPPYAQEKLDALGARLMPLLARARGEGSGVLRLNLFARDGTIIYSDLASLRGRVVSPLQCPPLARALAGTTATASASEGSTENADVVSFSAAAFATYVPVKLRGKVIGAYELDFNPAPVRETVQRAWVTLAGGFGLLVLLMLITARVIFRGSERGEPPVADRIAAAQELGRSHAQPPETDRGSSNGVSTPVPSYLLTRRELEVVRLMASNHSYGQIAAKLVIGEETVRTHAKNILHKLRQPDRVRAVAAAAEAGLLSHGVTQGDEQRLPSG